MLHTVCLLQHMEAQLAKFEAMLQEAGLDLQRGVFVVAACAYTGMQRAGPHQCYVTGTRAAWCSCMCAHVPTCCACGLVCAAADATNKSLESTLQESDAASAAKDRELQEALAQLVSSCC